VRKTYKAYISIYKEYSLTRYVIRSKKDYCLHNDVEAYMEKHDTSLSNLANQLVNNHFALARYTDPSFPI
jgi:putative transposon-encoded protein